MNRPAVIGLIGGMSWESSAEYYRIINREVQKRLGGVHSARSLMWSVDFGEMESLQHLGDWDKLTEQMIDAAIRLERGGADFVLMSLTPCTGWLELSPKLSTFLCFTLPIQQEKRLGRQDLEKSACSEQHLRWSKISTRCA